MSPDEKQILVEKIEALLPEQRKRVEGYVDALVERQLEGTTTRAQNEESGGSRPSGRGRGREETSEAKDQQDSKDRFLHQDWAGALSDLKEDRGSHRLYPQRRCQDLRPQFRSSILLHTDQG